MSKMKPLRLPAYTPRRHAALVKHFCLDLATDSGADLFDNLLGNTQEATDQNIALSVQAKFQEPTAMFLKQLALTRQAGARSPADAVRITIAKQVAHVPVPKKIAYCRALVTCGLLAGPQVFPECYVDRIHLIQHAKGDIRRNIDVLVPDQVDSRELAGTRNMQLLVTQMEADLGQYWQGARQDKQEAAQDWTNDPAFSREQKLKNMLRFIENNANSVKRLNGPGA